MKKKKKIKKKGVGVMGWGEGLVNYGKGVASFAKNKGGIYFGVGFFCLK